MASDFLKNNFASLRSKFKGSMTDEEKEKLKAKTAKEFNEYRKKIVGIAAGEKEIEFLMKNFLKEEDK
jgi:hypothetical protein